MRSEGEKARRNNRALELTKFKYIYSWDTLRDPFEH
jgi:hypothetical protein